MLEPALLLNSLLGGDMHLLSGFGRLLVPVELTGELHLCLNLGVPSNKHAIGQADTDLVLTALVSIVLVLLIGPDDPIIKHSAVRVVNIQLNSIHLLFQILIKVVGDVLVQNINGHFESLHNKIKSRNINLHNS